jgi:hypothetical protein
MTFLLGVDINSYQFIVSLILLVSRAFLLFATKVMLVLRRIFILW